MSVMRAYRPRRYHRLAHLPHSAVLDQAKKRSNLLRSPSSAADFATSLQYDRVLFQMAFCGPI